MTTLERQQYLLDIIRKQPGNRIRVPEFVCREKRPESSRTQGRGGVIADGRRLSNPTFATLNQITHLFTDGQFDPWWIQPWQKLSMALTVCFDSTENSPFWVDVWSSQQLPV